MILADAGDLSWNLAGDLQGLFAFHFMVNAFRAGTAVAITAAVIGWFMVLRRETFVGHTLAIAGFPGAAGATLLGIAAGWGYFAFCIGGALIVAALPRRGGPHGFSEESAVVGTLQAGLLACGLLFISLYQGFLNGVNALLFGSFLGITDAQVVTLLIVGLAALCILAVIGRPLLFASIDPDVAIAGGAPLRLLTVVFLVVLGTAAGAVSQITGTLLVFALLVVPSATAQLLTARPLYSLALSAGIGVAVTWLGLAAAYYSSYPVGFFITTIAFGAYAAVRLLQARPVRRRAALATARGA